MPGGRTASDFVAKSSVRSPRAWRMALGASGTTLWFRIITASIGCGFAASSNSHHVTEQLAAGNVFDSSEMLPQRIVRASALRNGMSAARWVPIIQRRTFLPAVYTDKKTVDEKFPEAPSMTEAEDPEQNGGYINPPRIKRQFRDPYADWWDKQERRNFGEPIHEDNDMLAIFSPWEYTWTTTGPGLIMVGTFVAVFMTVTGLVYLNYPDRPAYPREFEGGLERELGGIGARRARMDSDEAPPHLCSASLWLLGTFVASFAQRGLPLITMRFEDWDILLFPRDCKIPLKEFKVACHVVHDAEFSHTQGSFGLPTVSCFVPSLPTGTLFQISMHSWTVPTISQVTKAYTKYPDSVKFEARLFIDGRLVASTSLDRNSGWPHVISHSFDFLKNGDLEPLKFPTFRQELLQQNYWSPADDMGRIKVVISEGFPRDSLSMPIERVKNIVAFSFQHAPLEILESSSIAWPNQSMWRRSPFTASMPVPTQQSQDLESHAHSPRRRDNGVAGASSGYSAPVIQGIMSNSSTSSPTKGPMLSMPLGAGHVGPDPFGNSNAYFEWLSTMGMGMGMNDAANAGQTSSSGMRNTRRTSTDVSMPDYPSQAGQFALSGDGHVTLPTFQPEDAFCGGHMKVPTNTPITATQSTCKPGGAPFPIIPHNASLPADLATSLTNSLLNQPIPLQLQAHNMRTLASEVRSRKENRFQKQSDILPSMLSSTLTPQQEHQDQRKVSQQMYPPSGSSVPVNVAQPLKKSPNDGYHSAQRTPSVGRFGANIANLAEQDATLDVPASLGISSEKGTKRVRNFTPRSTKVVEEDEPRGGSPRMRLTPFTDISPTPRAN
ncbi:hypothetical protein G7046_g2725 [Stylonectria norvegica]|nr:hypothetical protein G7046_g2725 [Stylonectria norvegica]